MLKSKRMVVVLLLILFTLTTVHARDYLLASSYPLYYPLKHMAGERFEVDVLIRKQADPHHYELKPDDMKRLHRAKAFIYLGVERWELRLADRLGKNRAYPAGQGIPFLRTGRSTDPHLWLSPKSYTHLVKNIQQVLSSLDPAGSEHYRKKAEELLAGLSSLDEEYGRTLSRCRSRTLVTTHLSTAYLGRDYGLEVVGLRGVHAEEEPKPSEIKRLIERIRKAQVRVIFAELGQDEGLARRIAQEVGAEVITINSSLFPEEKGDDYFSIMKRNLKRLSEGLGCQTG